MQKICLYYYIKYCTVSCNSLIAGVTVQPEVNVHDEIGLSPFNLENRLEPVFEKMIM